MPATEPKFRAHEETIIEREHRRVAPAAGLVLIGSICVDLAMGAAHLVNLAGLPVIDRSILLFDLDAERNLPTWWSSAKLLLVAAVLGLAAAAPRIDRRTLAFLVLAVAAFAFLSLDEYASIHEQIGRRTRSDFLPVTGLWPFLYATLGFAAAGALAITGRSFLGRDRLGATCLIGGLVAFIAFAAGLDLAVNLDDVGEVALQALIFVEEMGELFSVSVMLYGAWRLVAPGASLPSV